MKEVSDAYLEGLQIRLDLAVEMEEFEEAARLLARIKRLTKDKDA